MSWLDIVIIVLLIFAVWEGWKQGLVRQVLGLAALALGVFLAWKFGNDLGSIFGLEGTTATVVGFIIILVVVILSMGLLGWLTRGLFKLVGLGIFDNILGVVLSALKMLLVAGILLMLVEFLDPREKAITRQIKRTSPMYKATTAVTGFVFPYVDMITGKVWDAAGRKSRNNND